MSHAGHGNLTPYDRFLLGLDQHNQHKHLNDAQEAWEKTKKPSTLAFIISTTFSAYLIDTITHTNDSEKRKKSLMYLVLGLNTVATTYFYNLMTIQQ